MLCYSLFVYFIQEDLKMNSKIILRPKEDSTVTFSIRIDKIFFIASPIIN
jgi:hypothetical protein